MRPAHAGEGIYRCIGANGEAVFTGSRAGYSHCRRLAASMPVPQSRHHGAPEPSLKSGKEHWDYRQSRPGKTVAVEKPRRGSRILRGAVYRVVHADGSVEYTNVRPRGRSRRSVQTLFTYIATCVACDVHSRIDWHTVPLNTKAFSAAIARASAESGVSRALLRAVIHAESAFNPRAMSDKGAQGLMQLMPATASSLHVDDAFDAAQNIRGGALYLAQLLKRFHGDERMALAAYNAGPDAVKKYGRVPPYAETRVYVKRVRLLRQRYAAALGRPEKADTHVAG